MDPFYYGHSRDSFIPPEREAPAEAEVSDLSTQAPQAYSSSDDDYSLTTVVKLGANPQTRSKPPTSATIQSAVGWPGSASSSQAATRVCRIRLDPSHPRSCGSIEWVADDGKVQTTDINRHGAAFLQLLNAAPNVPFSKADLLAALPQSLDITKVASSVRKVIKDIPDYDLLSIWSPGEAVVGYMLRTRPLQPIWEDKDKGVQLTALTLSGPDRKGGTTEVGLTERDVKLLLALFTAPAEGISTSDLVLCLLPDTKRVSDVIGSLRDKVHSLAFTIDHRFRSRAWPAGAYLIRWG